MVVFEEQLECGLRLPSSDFLESVLDHFNLEIQHISPNSFVSRCVDQESGLPGGLHGGLIRERLLQSQVGCRRPRKALLRAPAMGWIRRWFYLNAGEGSSLKSSGEEACLVPAPMVSLDDGVKFRIAAVASASRRFSMWDLTEEFVAAGI